MELELRLGLDCELDRFVARRSRRVHMNIRRQPNRGSQGDASAGNARAIGLPNVYFEVRRFDSLCDLRTQFRKELGDHACPGMPSTILRFEQLLLADPCSLNAD